LKTLKIGFSSSWEILDPGGDVSSLLKFLGKYQLEITTPQDADYLIYTVFNGKHHGEARPDAIKIFFTGENFCPDFNVCDYALSFEYLDYGDRHLRYPLYLFYPDVDKLNRRTEVTALDLKSRPHFCNFIVSNGKAEPARDAFFQTLDKRLHVHSAGRHLRNTESMDQLHPQYDGNALKRRYMQDFRFSLAFENSSHPGYVTEKIVDAFMARTVPIYWGDPRVCDEFNPDSFVNVHDFADWETAIDYIVALNDDEQRMLAMLNTSPLKKPDQTQIYQRKLQSFLENIFDQPIATARRRPRAGFALRMERRRRRDESSFRRWFRWNRV
jgi:alpha(1,3/1,4) fucosyltransferase